MRSLLGRRGARHARWGGVRSDGAEAAGASGDGAKAAATATSAGQDWRMAASV
jgi:hypothetical protein